MSTRIEIRDLRKEYRSRQQGLTRAVDSVSITIEAGELFFLLGPSGCGKTTLLRMVAGFIEPTSGQILFNGSDVARTPPNKRNTGMVFQSYALWPHMSVAQNVAYGLKVRKVSGAERERRVAEALAAVRMEAYAARKPNQLSGGQQQRVALARALVVRPAVLLLDEPLSNLDAKLRLEMRHEIRRICKESGLTTLYVTHDQKEALSMADRIAVLESGKVVQVGPPRELYRKPRTRFVADFLGEANFIEAKVSRVEGGVAELAAAAGTVRAELAAGRTLSPGAVVTCTIRPEAWRLVPRGGGGGGSGGGGGGGGGVMPLDAVIRESVYLGEVVQHSIELAGGQRGLVTEMHPKVMPAPGTPVGVIADPADVIVLEP